MLMTFLSTLYRRAAAIHPTWFMQTLVIGGKPPGAVHVQATSFKLANLDAAARWLESASLHSDCYVSMGIASEPSRGNRRWSAAEVELLVALWIDVDIADEKHPKRPADTGEALRVILEGPEIPSMVVETGSGGGHGHWVLDAPMDAATTALACQEWQRHLGRGYKLDSTGDAARVMRAAGTVNQKNGVAATLHAATDRTYALDALVTAPSPAPSSGAPAKGAATGGAALGLEGTNTEGPRAEDIVPEAEAYLVAHDMEAEVDGWCENDEEMRGILERTIPKDDSGIDLAICSKGDLAGMDRTTRWAFVLWSFGKHGILDDTKRRRTKRVDHTYANATLDRGELHPLLHAREQHSQESSQQTLNL